ncbi:MAG: S1 RNA-binding domain-containing protein [bacterium]|nr:S1 RNA-binding domain-containing protein [bacterium]
MGKLLRRFSWLRVAAVAGKRVFFAGVLNRRLGRVFETDAGEVGVQFDDGARGLMPDESLASVGDEVEVGLVDIVFDGQVPKLVLELCSIRNGAQMQAKVLGVNEEGRFIVDLYGETATLYPSRSKKKPFVGRYLEVVVTRDDDQIEVAQVSSLDPTLNPSEPQGRLADDLSERQTDDAWQKIESAYKEGRTINGQVIDRIKGGLLVDVGLRAFLPGSLVDIKPVMHLESLKGHELQFKVISLNRRRNNIVLSRKAVLEKEFLKRKAETLDKLTEGAWLHGVVKNITDYGVFVDLGGIDGLLHTTDISWSRANHPSEHFSVGDGVEVVVLKFDPETERVSLGYKQRGEDPWTLVDKKYPIGSRVFCRVINLVDHGALVELEKGVECLINVNEISWNKKVVNPVKTLKVGDELEATISALDMDQRRISLSLRQISHIPWKEFSNAFPLGSIIEGRIQNLTDSAVFVKITADIDGRIPLSEADLTKQPRQPTEVLKMGDMIKARIADVDIVNQCVSLSPVLEYEPDTERIRDVGHKQRIIKLWSLVGERYSLGSRIKVEVVSLVSGGAIVELEEGIQCRIPSSEMSWHKGKGRRRQPVKFPKVGETVSVVISGLDIHKRSISLSLRQAVPNPWKELSESFPLGSVIEGRIRVLTHYSAYVEITEDINGRIPLNEHPTKNFKKDDVVKARIIEVDTVNQRVLLSAREFLPDERTDSVITKVVRGVEINFVPGEISCSSLSSKLNMKRDQIEGTLQRASLGYIEFCRPLAYEEFEVVTDSLQSVDHDAGEDSWQSSVENIPWEDLVAQHRIGDTVVGKVIYVTDFGLFINILKGPSGFAAVSEIDLAVGNVANHESDWVSLKDHYHVGNWVKARIARIEAEKKRVAVTMHDIPQPDEEEISELKEADRQREGKDLSTTAIETKERVEADPQ